MSDFFITTADYSTADVSSCPIDDLRAICGISIDQIRESAYPDLFVFPHSIGEYDSDLGRKSVGTLDEAKCTLSTGSLVGFVGRNNTLLSIHSRFGEPGDNDLFLHYMMQRVMKFNLLSLTHSFDSLPVFDFLPYLFPAFLNRAAEKGIYSLYVPRRHNDSSVKGPIDIGRHIRRNIPFNGRIAYNTRELSNDNHISQLIRHTIEHISRLPGGKDLLLNAGEAVARIREATPSYSRGDRKKVIGANMRPTIHPYYREYAPLQKLCMAILRHEELKYGRSRNRIFGVLIDAAWLWEEYLAEVMKERFIHCVKKSGKRYYLFTGHRQRIIPDYLSADLRTVADAKYIPLDRSDGYVEEKATAIYYKTIAYMYRFGASDGYLLYPRKVKDTKMETDQRTLDIDCSGGRIIKLGMAIPQGCGSFASFRAAMEHSEKSLLASLHLPPPSAGCETGGAR